MSQGTFTTADRGRLNELAVKGPATRFVRFTMRSPQVPDIGVSCPGGSYDGCTYMAVTELTVHGRPATTQDAQAVTTGHR